MYRQLNIRLNYIMSKKELLDPIGSLCRLISLAFMPKGTKISIHNHILILDKPDKLQFMYRMINGDTRDNISEIYDVIIRVIQWYIVSEDDIFISDAENYINKEDKEYPQKILLLDSDHETLDSSSSYSKVSYGSSYYSDTNYLKIQNSNEIKKLLTFLIKSFEKMQLDTYNNGNVILAIQFYINIINMSLNNMKIDNFLPHHLDCETLIDYNKLKNLWKLEELKYICNKYEECFNIMNSKQYEDDGNLEGRDIIINGIISYVDDKLNKKNTEFQKLIKNSTG